MSEETTGNPGKRVCVSCDIKPDPKGNSYVLVHDPNGPIAWDNFDPTSKDQIWRILVAIMESQAGAAWTLQANLEKLNEKLDRLLES
jgi:hypothetical protein